MSVLVCGNRTEMASVVLNLLDKSMIPYEDYTEENGDGTVTMEYELGDGRHVAAGRECFDAIRQIEENLQVTTA